MGDSTYGLQLLAAPGPRSKQARKQYQSVTITLQPASTRLWASGVAALVESIAKLPPPQRTPFMSLALKGDAGRSWLRLSLGAKPKRETPFDLEIYDSSDVSRSRRPVVWSILASASDVLGLLTALDAVAERSALDSTKRSFDSTGIYPVDQLDGMPTVINTPRIEYPPAALSTRQEGLVWVEFVIDATGKVESGTIRLLMSDADELAQPVLDALPSIRYTPPLRNGLAVKARARAPFIFMINRPTWVPMTRVRVRVRM